MRVSTTCAALLAAVAFEGCAAPNQSVPATPFTAQPGDLHAFYGQIKGINRSARTVTLELGMRFTFRVPVETQITERGGGAVGFEAVKLGEGAQVVARRGGDNIWTATKITLEPGATFADVISVKTVQGRTISGPAVAEFIAYEPPGERVTRNIDFGQRSGLFLLSVRPDGTVATVKPIKSLGFSELDERATRWFMKWKFRPNTITEVRAPISFSSFRLY